jgi:hypothetical protein
MNDFRSFLAFIFFLFNLYNKLIKNSYLIILLIRRFYKLFFLPRPYFFSSRPRRMVIKKILQYTYNSIIVFCYTIMRKVFAV